tara:strand:+ start:8059 stop:8208 length:150 start_codon:yes stop_codon:yes gene_type:complete
MTIEGVILGIVFIGAVIVFIKYQGKKKKEKEYKPSKHVGTRPPKPPRAS